MPWLYQIRKILLGLVVSFGLLTLGCALLIQYLSGPQGWQFDLFWQEARQSRQWTPHEAYVEAHHTVLLGDESFHRQPWVLFMYSAGGKTVHARFRSSKLKESYFFERDAVEALEKHFPLGSKFSIWIDQNNPKSWSIRRPANMDETREPEKFHSPVLYFLGLCLLTLVFLIMTIAGYRAEPGIELPNTAIEPGAPSKKQDYGTRHYLKSIVMIVIVSGIIAGTIYQHYMAEQEKHRHDLHTAAEQGRATSVKKLLEDGAPVNGINRYGFRPLHLAAMAGHEPVVRLLIEKGALVNALTWSLDTPLDLAANEAVRKALRKQGGKTSEELKVRVKKQ